MFNPFKKIYSKLRFSFYNLFLMQLDLSDILQVNAEIIRTKIEKDEQKNKVNISFVARLKIINNTSGTVSFINPEYLASPRLKLIPEENIYEFKNAGLSENFLSELNRKEKISESDSDVIKNQIIINLNKKESFEWHDEVFARIDYTKKTRGWKGMSLEEMMKIKTPLYVRIEYRLPQNREKIIEKLTKLNDPFWLDFEKLAAAQYRDKDVINRISEIKSQPFFLDLPSAV